MNLHDDIKSVIQSFDSLQKSGYTMKGLYRDIEKIQIKDPSGVLSASDTIEQKYISILITDIYNNLYNTSTSSQELRISYKNNDFISDLSNANHGAGYWEEGWRFIGSDEKSGRLIVQKDELKFWAEPARVRQLDETRCTVKVEKECRYLNGPFYFAYGNIGKARPAGDRGQVIRFYWNILPSSAVDYIDVTTRLLNDANIAFSTKVLSDPDRYTRSDGVVLYVNENQLDDVLALIPDIYCHIQEGIKEPAPLFVKKILPGLGFAEDPSNGLSFGISRAKLIAETIYHCLQHNISGSDKMSEELIAMFEKAGISAESPYASARNVNNYEGIISKHINSWKLQLQ